MKDVTTHKQNSTFNYLSSLHYARLADMEATFENIDIESIRLKERQYINAGIELDEEIDRERSGPGLWLGNFSLWLLHYMGRRIAFNHPILPYPFSLFLPLFWYGVIFPIAYLIKLWKSQFGFRGHVQKSEKPSQEKKNRDAHDLYSDLGSPKNDREWVMRAYIQFLRWVGEVYHPFMSTPWTVHGSQIGLTNRHEVFSFFFEIYEAVSRKLYFRKWKE